MFEPPSPPPPQSVPRGLLVTALLIVVIWGLWAARAFFIPITIAAVLAFLANPVVRGLKKIKMPEGIAIGLSLLLIVLPIASLTYLLVREGQALAHDFPKLSASLNQTFANFAHSSIGKWLHVEEYLKGSSFTERILQSAGAGVSFILSGLTAILGVGSQALLVFLFTIFMLASREHLRRSGEAILARFETIESARMLDAVLKLVEHFLVARLLIVVGVGFATMGLLSAFGLSYVALLGAFTGVMTLVPVLGWAIAIVLNGVVALAMGHSLATAFAVVGILLVMNIIEGNYLTPKFVGGRVNINALSTFVGFFAGGLLWGIWGMFLSIPVLGILRIAFSAAPSLQPWGELLAEREDKALTRSLLKRRHHQPA